MADAELASIQFEDQPFDLDFHPQADVVATALISGVLELHGYGEGEPCRLWTLNAHTESCRAVRFIDGGSTLISASPDRSILAIDVQTGKPSARLSNAHGAAINRLTCLNNSTIASGDDDGTVKVWDTRQQECVVTFTPHEDFIADMGFSKETSQLFCASGDGCLSICNLRKKKVEMKSENAEDELLSVVIMKNRKKVVCGTQGGVLMLYSWGYFKDCSDRFPGHPQSIDALLKVDEDILVTGSSDGLIRVVSILPNRFLGLIGEHSEYPVERLAFSRGGSLIGSISHDSLLKLWDASVIGSVTEGFKGDTDQGENVTQQHERGSAKGMDMDDGDDDDDDNNESEGASRRSRTRKGKGKSSPSQRR